MMKPFIKYLLCLCILLLSAYSSSYARKHKGHLHVKHHKRATLQGHLLGKEQSAEPLFIKAAPLDTEKEGCPIDVVETEVEELTFSRKPSGDRNYLTSISFMQNTPEHLFGGNTKIFSYFQYHSYRPSYRYLMFEVFRI